DVGPIASPNLEAIAALKPDLIVSARGLLRRHDAPPLRGGRRTALRAVIRRLRRTNPGHSVALAVDFVVGGLGSLRDPANGPCSAVALS
ncbi:hypothetical protein AB0D18_38795, partial [Streptomyces sp. NPDC048442]